MEPGILIIRSFPVDQSCAAADAPSVGTGREKYKGKRRSKEPREERAPRSDVLEDIYTIEDGWSVHIDPAEEMIKIAGVQVPVRLKQRVQNERKFLYVLFGVKFLYQELVEREFCVKLT